MIKERTNEMADDGNLELRGRETCSISELRMLLEGRDPAEPVEKFIRKWSPIAYGMAGELSIITTDEWPLLKDLPCEIKCKAAFANVTEYYGSAHAFIHTIDKKTFYAGDRQEFGKAAEAAHAREVKELRDLDLVAIHMGPYDRYPFACAHAADGTIYTIGRGEHGNLGHRDCKDLPLFKQVDGLSRIIQVSCGSRFCTTLDVDGKISTFGDNKVGQCAMNSSGSGQHCSTPQRISALDETMPIFATCGLRHSVVVDRHGQLVSYGENNEHQLGRECMGKWSATPTAVTHLGGHQIQKVVCGWDHTLCLTITGLLLSWGYNRHGQAGVGGTTDVETPVIIDFNGKRVVDVLAVGFTSLVITSDGMCFMWGRHDGEDIKVPRMMDIMATPRDLLVKGYRVSTGGCVQFESMESLRCRLDEEISARKVAVKQLDEVSVAHSATKQQLQATKQQLKATHQQLNDVNTAHEATKHQLEDVLMVHKATKQQLEDVSAEYDAIKQKLEAYQDHVRGLQHEIAALQSERKHSLEREKTLLDILQRFHTLPVQAPPHHQGTVWGVAATQPGFHAPPIHAPLQPQQGAIKNATAAQTGFMLAPPIQASRHPQQGAIRDVTAAQPGFHAPPNQAHLYPQRGPITGIATAQTENCHTVSQQISISQRQVVREGIDAQLQDRLALGAHDQLCGHHQSQMGGTAAPHTALRPAEYHAIMKNYPILVSDMPANQAIDFMFAGKVINHQKTNKIMSPLLTEEDKARMILDSVLRHPKGYATLIEALDSPQCSADWLAERLRKDVEEFERRTADEHT